jgi:endonuclease YncB( thermonuclease family)
MTERYLHLAAHTLLMLIALAVAPPPDRATQLKLDPFPPEHGTVTVLVTNVLDGDTVDGAFLVPCRFRLYGCNAPEKGSDAGAASTEALASILKPITLCQVELKGREKFGRQLADFKRPGTNESVTALLIATGKVKPWDGKGPRP